jgi:hypothetical protein
MLLLMMFQGYGALALVIPVLLYVGARSVDASPLAICVCLLVSAVTVWLIGWRINREVIVRRFSYGLGRTFRFKTRRHTMFYAPMQYWALPIIFLALYQLH